MADGDDFNGKVIAEFRANGGKAGGFFDAGFRVGVGDGAG